MTNETSRYRGRVLKRVLIENMKCYFVENNVNDLLRQTPKDIDENRKILEELGIAKSLGYATLWNTDFRIARVDTEDNTNPFGFELSTYKKETGAETLGFKDACYIDAIILGTEAKILLESKTKKEYLSRWCMQETFEKKDAFTL